MDIKADGYAAIYARKSILNDNNSIEAQISYGKDKLLENGLVLYEIYRDEISATETGFRDRPAFSKLLKDAEAGKFKTVVVFRRDRLARRVHEFKEIQYLFKQFGVNVLYSNPGEYIADENSFSAGFIENLIIAMDELEAKVIKERTSSGRQKKRERGEYASGGKTPLGYQKLTPTSSHKQHKDDKDKGPKYDFVPDENVADVIRFIFRQYVNTSKVRINQNCYSKEDFVEEIRQCYKSHSILHKKADKLIITKLEDIIKNPIYCGYMYRDPKTKLKDITYQDEQGNININLDLLQQCTNVKPIIYLHQWIPAVKCFCVNSQRIKSPPVPYLFKGLLFCKCGTKLSIHRVAKYPQYDHFRCKKCHTSIPFSTLTDTLLSVISKSISAIEVKSLIKEKICMKIEAEENRLKGIKGKITKKFEDEKNLIKQLAEEVNHKDAILDAIIASISDKEELTINKVHIENSIYILDDSLRQVERVTNSDILAVGINYFKRDIKEGQEILERLIERIDVEIYNKQLHSYDINYGKELKWELESEDDNEDE